MTWAQRVFKNKMPWVNCAIVCCGTSCRTKGIGIFKSPAAKNNKYKKWREEWVSEIKFLMKYSQCSPNRHSNVPDFLFINKIACMV